MIIGIIMSYIIIAKSHIFHRIVALDYPIYQHLGYISSSSRFLFVAHIMCKIYIHIILC
jgi:hypothetical protein